MAGIAGKDQSREGWGGLAGASRLGGFSAGLGKLARPGRFELTTS